MAKLFERAMIGNVEVKNRLAMSPMAVAHTDCDGSYSDLLIDYYVERAKGGYGIIFPAGAKVSCRFEPNVIPNVLKDPHNATRLGILCNQIHHYGAKICIQLTIGVGRVASAGQLWDGTVPKSASVCNCFWEPDKVCEPYTVEEIQYLVEEFGRAAKLARDSGADMVEIHGYGGYLIDQFISEQWNHRTDEYGGSREKRLRLVLELLEAVRKYCGEDFPVILKFTPDHGYEGGRKLEEGIEILKYLDDKGFAAFHLDYGCWETWYNAVTTVYEKDGVQLFMSKACKEAGIKTPIMAVGKLTDPAMVHQVIESGIADFVLQGHQSIADPYWPKKVKNGRYDDICHCIGCNECMQSEFVNRPLHCAVNPVAGFEREYVLTPAPEKKSVLVVGGGPGGMVASIAAAQRGLDVELWEREDELGGFLRAAAMPAFKLPVKRYLEYLKTQVSKHKIDVKFHKEATAEEILARKPDVVILAAGSNPIVPKIEGADNLCVVEATAMLKKNHCPGKKVIVLGGGLVGCEASLHLDQCGKDVTIIEMAGDILTTADHCLNNDMALRKMMRESNIHVMTGTRLVRAEKDAVIAEADGKTTRVPCDTLVIAVGYRSDRSLEDALMGKIEKVFTIGSNVKARKILDATSEGYHTIRLLEQLDN